MALCGISGTRRDMAAEYQDCAVLYRTNAQSRLLEEKCILYNVPYRLVGGVNFYQRKEIKDILAYLKTIANGQDDLAVQRIINVPKRGIGATSMGKVTIFASEQGMSLYDASARKRGRYRDLERPLRRSVCLQSQIEDFRAWLQIGGAIHSGADRGNSGGNRIQGGTGGRGRG